MQKLFVVFGLCLLSGCIQETSIIQNDEVQFKVQGPMVSNTSVHEELPPLYEQYLLNISHIKKNIYVPFLIDSNVYDVTSHNAFKVINKDTIYTSGGTADYFSQHFRLLEKGIDYEFSFFLSKPEFVPDTVLIWFKYYPDSLAGNAKTLELVHSSYRSL